MAFLGRYGHQPADAMLRLPVADLRKLSVKVAELVEKEGEAMRLANGGG